MRNWIKSTATVLALASTVAACDDYLEGEGLTTDPNRPQVAAIDQIYNAVQARQFLWHNGDLARTASLFTQQIAGTDRQYIDRDNYVITEDDFSIPFTEIYGGGGLVDIRLVQSRAEEQNDRVYAGIAKVWEAYLIGMAASLWGDIPYSQAVSDVTEPQLDEQAAVYAAVQSLLDEAIADLRSGTGDGPGALDLVYMGDAQKWAQAAYTLKARFYMHWVEAQNTASTQSLAQTACGGDCVQNALNAAQNGIASPANNFVSFHTAKRYEENPWYQFTVIERPGYASAGRNLVELLRSRNDPRLTEFFAPVAGGDVVGAAPGASGTASQLNPATRGSPEFGQPLITYAENELIMAESQFRLNNPAQALVHLNNARMAANLTPLTGITGDPLLREIALEKYIALFQNVEAWNDYKRLCIPELTPVAGTEVPGRLLYGSDERNANQNIPAPSEQPARNDNDPNACS